MRVRGKGLPAPDRETLTARGSRLRLRGRVEPVMAQLCGPRRCGALLALLASLLVLGAEAADGEPSVHGEGPGGSPGRGGRLRGRGRGIRVWGLRWGARGKVWSGRIGGRGNWGRPGEAEVWRSRLWEIENGEEIWEPLGVRTGGGACVGKVS